MSGTVSQAGQGRRRAYPKPGLMLLNSYIVLAAWLCLLIIVASFFLSWILGWPVYGMAALLLVLPLAAAHFVLSVALRCPECGKLVTMQGSDRIHPNARSRWGLGGWGAIILDAVLKREFVCIHCGTLFEVASEVP